jgi:hypothetical protein
VREESSMGGANRATGEPVVKPEGCGRAISDLNIGDGSVSIEFIIDDLPEIAVSITDRVIKASNITKKPLFPGSWLNREQLVDELQQQATVLKVQVLNPEAARAFPGLYIFPGY